MSRRAQPGSASRIARRAVAASTGRAAIAVATVLVAAACGSSPDGVTRGEPAAVENVLLVTLDTTRADHLGVYGGDVRTPRLDALAREGAWATHATTSVPITLPAHATLLTGMYPTAHGVHDNGRYLAADTTTLAEILRDAGYATFGAVGAYVLHGSWGIGDGFETFDDTLPDDAAGRERDGRAGEPSGAHAQRDGAEVVAAATRWLAERPRDRPFFAWVHLYDPHYPYAPPAEYAAMHPGRPYAGEVAYADALVGRLLDALEAESLDGSTLVVVTADHGEGLDEHGEADHGIFLYESTMRVPWIARDPARRLRGEIGRLVRDVDLLPTVLDALGIEPPAGTDGESVLAAPEGGDGVLAYGETLYPRYHYGWSALRSLRDERYKFIDAPRAELYDLERDPGERTNLLEAHPGIVERLSESLAAIRVDEREDAAPATVDPDAMARLRALGYVSGVARADGDDADLPDPKDRLDDLGAFTRLARRSGELLRAEDYAALIALADDALARAPGYIDGYLAKARALRLSGRPRAAIEAAREGLRAHEDGLELLVEAAAAHLAVDEPDATLALVARIHALAPRFLPAYLTAADAHVARGDEPAAIGELERALELAPEFALARYEIGRLELRRGRFAEAERAIREALSTSDRLYGARFNLALVAERRGDLAAAEAEYLAEVRTFPDNHEAWANLGLLYAGRGDLPNAEQAFRSVVEQRPDSWVGYVLLARLWASAGVRRAEVFDLLESAERLAPDEPQVRSLRARLGRRPA